MDTAVFILTIFMSMTSGAATYRSGADLVRDLPDVVAAEGGFFVDVPKDYARADRGSTRLYVSLPFGFERSRESVVFFQGGPGASIHGISEDLEWMASSGLNVVTFDQRGIAFSRPDDERDYLDPDFYSSESTARDADEIRRALKLERWSLFGHSYGTVPATIYGHLFPEHVVAVTLASVVSGDLEPRRYALCLLDHQMRRPSIADLRRRLELLGRADAVREFESHFERTIGQGGKSDLSLFVKYWSTQIRTLAEAGERMTSVQMGRAPGSDLEVTVVDRNVKTLLNVRELRRTREPAWGPWRHHYRATEYPLKVPVTYLHGTLDPVTPPIETIHHFKHVARGPRQLWLIEDWGHNLPTRARENWFHGEREPNPKWVTPDLVRKAFLGQPIDRSRCVHLLVESKD